MLEGVSYHPAWELSSKLQGSRGERGVGCPRLLPRLLLSFKDISQKGPLTPVSFPCTSLISLPLPPQGPYSLWPSR